MFEKLRKMMDATHGSTRIDEMQIVGPSAVMKLGVSLRQQGPNKKVFVHLPGSEVGAVELSRHDVERMISFLSWSMGEGCV